MLLVSLFFFSRLFPNSYWYFSNNNCGLVIHSIFNHLLYKIFRISLFPVVCKNSFEILFVLFIHSYTILL